MPVCYCMYTLVLFVSVKDFVGNLTTDLVQELNFNRTDLDHLQM